MRFSSLRNIWVAMALASTLFVNDCCRAGMLYLYLGDSVTFSLGVTFYSFLAGELPLSHGQAATHLPAIVTQRPDVPPDVQLLLAKMLAPNQEQRIQTMAEVARELQAYATQG